VVAQPLERLAPAGRLERLEAGVAGPLPNAEAQRALVVDDQDGSSALGLRGLVAFAHDVSPSGS